MKQWSKAVNAKTDETPKTLPVAPMPREVTPKP